MIKWPNQSSFFTGHFFLLFSFLSPSCSPRLLVCARIIIHCPFLQNIVFKPFQIFRAARNKNGSVIASALKLVLVGKRTVIWPKRSGSPWSAPAQNRYVNTTVHFDTSFFFAFKHLYFKIRNITIGIFSLFVFSRAYRYKAKHDASTVRMSIFLSSKWPCCSSAQ